MFLFGAVIFIGCDSDDDPVASVEHNVVGGIELYIDDILVHKQFGGAFYNANGMVGSTAESSIDLNPNTEYEIEVIFLNLSPKCFSKAFQSSALVTSALKNSQELPI